MIIETMCYDLKCDICGCKYYQEESVGLSDLGVVIDEAHDDGMWIEHDGKDVCPDCWEYDDDDNLVIKNKK